MAKKKKESKSRETKKENLKPLYWLVGFGIFLVILYFISGFVFKEITGFNYEGLEFTKEKFGDIPVFHHYYYFTDRAGDLVKYNFYLRIDPRKNNVPIEGEVEFDTQDRFNYISVDANLGECEYTSVAVASLSAFLTNNQIKVRGAMPDLIQAERNNVEFATCVNPKDRYVVLIEKGEETKIVREDMCYRVEISNCEVLEALEKLQIQALLDAKARAAKN